MQIVETILRFHGATVNGRNGNGNGNGKGRQNYEVQ